MLRGDNQAAWAISDHVLAARDPATRDDPRLPYHLRWVWDGRPFDGRHVLVRCYHGLGDTLQFARYLAPMRRRAASLTLEAPAPLLALLAQIEGPDRLIAFDPAAPARKRECDLEIMELAHALRLAPEAAPRPPYVRAPAVSAHPGAIGVCWQAGGWDPARSVPGASLLARLADRALLVLQPGPLAMAAPEGSAILNPQGCPDAIADTAALIAGLELVITVDTMVAHLAGALGRPTWLLLRHDCDWRWMSGRSSSPWYPSMRLYRQPAPGDWDAVLARLAADLRLAD